MAVRTHAWYGTLLWGVFLGQTAQYMLDPKVSGLVSRELDARSVVVFDEAHNIDNICVEALSVSLDRPTLLQSTKNLRKLELSVKRCASPFPSSRSLALSLVVLPRRHGRSFFWFLASSVFGMALCVYLVRSLSLVA
jgi:hypothetical protein